MIIDGRKTAERIRIGLAEKIRLLDHRPKLRVILVGNNPASLSYVGRKEKACAEVGIDYECLTFNEDTDEEAVLSAIAQTNADPHIH